MTDQKIIFMGTPEISAYVLEGLVKAGFNIVGVVTKEDKERGRGKVLTPSPVALKVAEYNIPVHIPHRLNKDYAFLEEKKPDLILTFAYGQIVSETILSLSRLKPLNLHGSILPKYRGASPIQEALKQGDKETGITLMEMIKEMDAGDIYAVKKIEIEDDDNYTSLSNKLAKTALELAIEALPIYFEGKLNHIPQNPEEVSFCSMIKKEEEHLNLEWSSERIINQIRALSYEPGAYLDSDIGPIKIYKASKYSSEITAETGTIIFAKKKQIVLQLSDGQILIKELQRPGKKIMSAADFNNGFHTFEGMVLR